MRERIRLGFVCSSGGGVVDAMAAMSGGDFGYEVAAVITDRPCGAEAVATRHAIPTRRIIEPDADRFSIIAATHLGAWRVDAVVLLFTRLVGPALWHDQRHDQSPVVYNLHPSLLPRHRGLGALARSHAEAVAARARGVTHDLGVTLHHVTGEPDAGPVIGQGRFGVELAAALDAAEHVCFLIKLALLLEAIGGDLRRDPPSPPITERAWRGGFRGLVPRAAVLEAVGAWARPPAAAWLANLRETVTR